MHLININGPINSGKTTIAKALSEKLDNVLFVDIDPLVSDEEETRLELLFEDKLALRLSRFDELVSQEKAQHRALIFSYPLDEPSYQRWSSYKHVTFKAVTLSLPLEACLKNRGTRELSKWEKERICWMYENGYDQPQNTDFIVSNHNRSIKEVVTEIIALLKL